MISGKYYRVFIINHLPGHSTTAKPSSAVSSMKSENERLILWSL
jgi:hypothetical protein